MSVHCSLISIWTECTAPLHLFSFVASKWKHVLKKLLLSLFSVQSAFLVLFQFCTFIGKKYYSTSNVSAELMRYVKVYALLQTIQIVPDFNLEVEEAFKETSDENVNEQAESDITFKQFICRLSSYNKIRYAVNKFNLT